MPYPTKGEKMYQVTLGRFIFTTLFRSFTFVASAVAVFLIKHYMEKKQYAREERMVFNKSNDRTRTSGRSDGIKRQAVNKKPSNYGDPW